MFRLIELTPARPALISACARILRDEWPTIAEERLREVVDYGHDESGFPCSLVMVEDQQPTEVIGHVRLTKVLDFSSSVYIESVVLSRPKRGRGLCRKLLNLAEDYAKYRGFSRMFLSILVVNASLYLYLGYQFCEPRVITLGSAMLGSSRAPPYTAALPGWEHLYIGIPPPSDLLSQEGTHDESKKQQTNCVDYSKPSELMMRTIKYSSIPIVSGRYYTWLAKEL